MLQSGLIMGEVGKHMRGLWSVGTQKQRANVCISGCVCMFADGKQYPGEKGSQEARILQRRKSETLICGTRKERTKIFTLNEMNWMIAD